MIKITGDHKIEIKELDGTRCEVRFYELTLYGWEYLGGEFWASTEEAKEEYGF